MAYVIVVCAVENSWWWTEELSETGRVLFQNKFEILVHLVGFIIRIYHDARSPERQIHAGRTRKIPGYSNRWKVTGQIKTRGSLEDTFLDCLNSFHLQCVNQNQKYISNHQMRCNIYDVFIHTVPNNIFRPVIRPPSERFSYYKNTTVVNCAIITP